MFLKFCTVYERKLVKLVRRLYVEKKKGFDVEARGLLSDLIFSLGIDENAELRLFNRYDIDGLSEDDFQRAKVTVFSEPNVDNTFTDFLPLTAQWHHFATEYLPGQYDQRADSAAQCVQLQNGKERPKIVTAKIIALKGNISASEMNKIKNYIINPVESREASDRRPLNLDIKADEPADIEQIKFIDLSDIEVFDLHKRMGFAMTTDDLRFCRDYFRKCERDPFLTELKVIDTYWSDHCRHTTFSTVLKSIEIADTELNAPIKMALDEYYAARQELYADRDKPVTLMDIATIGMKILKKRGLLPDLDESEEINACSIQVPVEIGGVVEQWLVQFKNETHNHPTEIEPFGGAATCLGGAIRDPLSGRAYVYQAMRVTGSGDPTVPFSQTLKGKLPQRKITTGAAHGYSSYGNQIGLATGQVSELYHEGYVAKRLEIGAVVGASPKSNVVRATPEDGDVIVLLGGRTGRDGCGGATGSSKAHDTHSIETCGAEVQKGNPPTERKLQRLFRDPAVSTLIKRCNDFGAGGVCVAIGELADGLIIDLDKVPKKYDGLDGTELAISESQERMAVVLDKNDVEKFIKAAEIENLEATPVAVVTEEPVLKMFWRGKCIVNLHRSFLDTNGVTGQAAVYISGVSKNTDYRNTVPDCLADDDIPTAFVKNLSRLEVASQKGLSERFDSSIGASSVLMPFGGKYQMTPEEAMIAKIPVLKGDTDDVTVMSYGYTPKVTEESPFHGSAFAVMESLSKIAAVGANPMNVRLTFQEYFERLNYVPARWGKPAAALLGAFAAQIGMGVAAIGGKDSMSGSFDDLDVPPTLVSFALAMSKASNTISASLKRAGTTILLIPMPVINKTRMPDFDRARVMYRQFHFLSQEGKVLSASVVKEGGIAAAVAKMSFGNRIGVDFELLDKQTLFSPITASIIVETENPSAFAGMDTVVIGKTTDREVFRFKNDEIEIAHALEAYESKLEGVFPTRSNVKAPMADVPLYDKKFSGAPKIGTAKPRVFIPVFPGTNCEYDTARAFERAGAESDILVVRNLTPSDIEETIEEMEKHIRRSQIVMLPGGFSGGDEPDGSGKFIATTFRNPKIKDAVMELLYSRDGLMLGICNGFQALIKLGLVPYGEIRDQRENDPTLTFNTIGRHISQMVYTRVTSVKSPWLAQCEVGDVHTVAVSHGEGRFVADQKTLAVLSANGQIATQYVDINGAPAADMPFNPNGSMLAIEGITSPDGRVFGKMGHSERRNKDCYVNVPGNKDQKIFESGVAYFNV